MYVFVPIIQILVDQFTRTVFIVIYMWGVFFVNYQGITCELKINKTFAVK